METTMELELEISPEEKAKREKLHASIMCHSGGRMVTRGDLEQYSPPVGIFGNKYEAYDHSEFVQDILYNIEKVFNTQDVVFSQEYAVKDTKKDGVEIPAGHMFGLMRLSLDDSLWEGDKLVTAIGIRSCWDGSFRPGASIGMNTFICDNMLFRGDNVMMHRSTPSAPARLIGHIRSILRKLPVDLAVGKAMREQARQISLTDDEAYGILGRMVGHKVLQPMVGNAAFEEWRNPSFDVFNERHAWSLMNGCTFALKKSPFRKIMDASERVARYFEEDVLPDWKSIEARAIDSYESSQRGYKAAYVGPAITIMDENEEATFNEAERVDPQGDNLTPYRGRGLDEDQEAGW